MKKLREQILEYINYLYINIDLSALDEDDFVMMDQNEDYFILYKKDTSREESRKKDLLQMFGLTPEDITYISQMDKEEFEQFKKLVKLNKLKKQVEQLENEINIK